MKFNLAHIKCDAVICSVLAPLTTDELKENLKQVHFVTMSIVTSNMQVPVLVRSFLPLEGVKVKLLDRGSIPGETSEILSSFLV